MAFNVDSSNKDAYEHGIWGEYQGSKFLIANTGNMEYQRLVTRLQQPHHKKIERGTLDAKVMKNLLCKGLAQGILKDWKDVVDGHGNDLPFSEEVAYKALYDNEDLRDFIIDYASNYENYKEEAVEEMVKS